MTSEMAWVFGLLAACIGCFIANRPRMDVVALIALVALVVSGTLEVGEALAGFSEPSVILIAAFFVIGEGLVRTGVAHLVGEWLVARAGNSETRLLTLLMLAVAGLGSVMSSTGVVALFIPVALSVARRIEAAPGRLMMPLAFAGLISGMLTLVGTPPNMVVNSELARAGHVGFAFFDFTPTGLIVLALGIAYMLIARRWLADQAPKQPGSQRRQRHSGASGGCASSRTTIGWSIARAACWFRRLRRCSAAPWANCSCGRASAPMWLPSNASASSGA